MGGTVIPTYLQPDQGWTPPPDPLAAPPAAVQPAAVQPATGPAAQVPASDMIQPTSYNGMTTDDAANHAVAVHNSRMAGLLNAVGGILGGNKSLRLVKNPDGSVDVQQVDATPGDRWGRVAEAALSGLANGFAVGQGPGGGARAAAAGIQTGLAQDKNQQQAVIDRAKDLNQQNQQNQLFKANMALLNQRNVAGAWELKRQQVQALEGEEDRNATIQKTMQDANATKIDVADMEDTANAYNSSPELQQAHHDGRTVFYSRRDPNTGKVIGGTIYIIPQDQMNALNPETIVRHRLILNPQDPKGPPVWDDSMVIPAKSTPMKQVAITQQADEDAANKIMLDHQQRMNQQQTADAATKTADAAMIRANAEAANAGAANKGTWQLMEKTDGSKVLFNDKTAQEMAAPAGLQKLGTAEKQADAIEKHVAPIREALNYATDYLTGNQFTGPGDEALMEKFFELAKPSSGFRMSQQQIDMFKESRSWMDSVAGRAYHTATGQWFPPKQRQQIVGTMNSLGKSAGVAPTGGTSGFNTPQPAPSGNTGQAARAPQSFSWDALPKVGP
jgi:hypothetical protein